MNIGLTKNYKAGGTIPARTLVKFGADDRTVVAAAAATDNVIGVSCDVDAVVGDPVDVQIQGIGLAIASAAITRGALLTSDAVGKAITAAPAAGVNNRIVGIAWQDAASGDIFDVLIEQGTVQG